MATLYAKAAGGNWSSAGTWSNVSSAGGDSSGPPTAADNVILDSGSGNVTIDSGAVCRSLDCNGYTGTLTHNTSVTLTIGDGTAGTGNRALRFVSGMTYTISQATQAISFVSTSGTTQTIDTGGKTIGNLTFNGAGGSWQFAANFAVGGGSTLTITAGSVDFNGRTGSMGFFSANNSNTKSITFGAATLTVSGSSSVVFNISAVGTTFSAASSTIIFSGTDAEVTPAALTYGTVRFTGAGTAKLNSTGATFANLERTGTTTKSDGFNINGAKTVTGTFTLAGNSAINRLLVFSNTVGTSVTITNTGATQTWSNVDFMDIDLSSAYNASAITGNSGDCGGNTNITFTTPATQTWSGTSGGNWSTNAWTSRVPLPQDDVIINSAFSASQTITADMPRLGKSISWSGSTGTPTWGLNSTGNTIFGSITLISGMTLAQDRNLTLGGRGSFTLTSAGKQYPSAAASVLITAPGGTYTLLDAFSTGGTINVQRGTLVTNDFNVTCSVFSSNSGTLVRGITLGTSTITLTNTGASTVWQLTSTGNLTFSGGNSTIVIAGSSASTKTFAGGNLTYGSLTYTLSGSTGALNITGSNTFTNINFSDASSARSLLFTAGTTTTILNSFNVLGTSGKLMTIGSITASGHTLSKSGGIVSCDYLSISRSTAQGGASWYAGANSTNGGNNSGWLFSAAPPAVGGMGSRNKSLMNLQNLRRL